MEEEIWKDIPEYEGSYQVSSLGRVRSLDKFKTFKDGRKGFWIKGKIRKGQVNKATGYVSVYLSVNGVKKIHYIHRLLAFAFWEVKSDSLTVIDHINHIKHDNRLCNLQVITQRQNTSKRINKKQKDSQYIGVSKSRKTKWRSSISISGESIGLGTFKSENVAHNVYTTALSNLHLYTGNKETFRESILKLANQIQ